MFTVVMMPIAEADIDEGFDWWRENRSVEQAYRWYREIYPAIASLSESAERRPLSPEAAMLGVDIREFNFWDWPASDSPHRVLQRKDNSESA